MANDILFLSYDAISNISYLRWLYKILRWILKKKGILKDYEDIYKTDNSLKVFANSLKKIGVNIDKFVEIEKIKIPIVLLFKQKTKHLKFSRESLRTAGFIPAQKSMGVWILPPKTVMSLGIKDYSDLAKHFNNMLVDNGGTVHIRFGLMTDYNKIFTYPPDKNEFKDLIGAELVRFIEVENLIRYAQKLNKQKISQTQADLINSTPLQHMFADFIPYEILLKLSDVEDKIIEKLENNGLIKRPSYFLHLKDIQTNELQKQLKDEGILIENVIIEQGKKHADFITNRIRL